MRTIPPPASDELLAAIAAAIEATPDAEGIHLSVEPHAREIAPPGARPRWMKAACWSLLRPGVDPAEAQAELVLVEEERNEDTLAADLRRHFPDLRAVVDHDILIEEED